MKSVIKNPFRIFTHKAKNSENARHDKRRWKQHNQ